MMSTGTENEPSASPSSSTTRTSSTKRLLKSTSLQPHHILKNNDMELAAEIGQGLLSEVRKMHSLLHQNRDAMMALELEKVEQEHQIDALTKHLKQKSEHEEKLKEEVWNLELAKQELMQQMQDLSQDLAKALAEQNKWERQESLAASEIDELRSAQLCWNEKAKEYEQEILSLCRTITQLQRQVTVLQKERQLSASSLLKHNTENGMQDHPPPPLLQSSSPSSEQHKTISNIDATPSISDHHTASSEPMQKKEEDDHAKMLNMMQLEIGTLKNSLDHAHDIIAVLERDLKHERVERQEVNKLLYEAQEVIEVLQQKPLDGDGDDDDDDCVINKRDNEDKGIKKTNNPALLATQRELSLGDELINAATTWDITALEPITNLITPAESPTFSTSSQMPSNNNSQQMDVNNQENFGTFIVRSNTYVFNNNHNHGNNDDSQQQHQALISPARASAFDFDPAFIKNSHKAQDALVPSDSCATLTTNLVPAVTRTMIGDWMYKYTRKVVGSGISEKKHKRFFWIHPYTRTMYWSSREPGMDTHANGNKSAMILSFQAIADDIDPPSIMVQTPTRSLKVRCLDILAHRAWMKALSYLVSDPTAPGSPRFEPSGSLSMLFQPRSRSSLLIRSQPPASKSLASIHAPSSSSQHNFKQPFFEFSFNQRQ